MGKNGTWDRNPRDFYPTPYECVPPLLPHLWPRTHFIEPCAGDGRLIEHLQANGHICEGASDIEPGDPCIKTQDALYFSSIMPYDSLTIITNPPWHRSILHPLIERFAAAHPTWLLIDMNWANTRRAAPLLKCCRKVVVIGRVKWIEDSKGTGKEDAGWFLFTNDQSGPPQFFGRE